MNSSVPPHMLPSDNDFLSTSGVPRITCNGLHEKTNLTCSNEIPKGCVHSMGLLIVCNISPLGSSTRKTRRHFVERFLLGTDGMLSLLLRNRSNFCSTSTFRS